MYTFQPLPLTPLARANTRRARCQRCRADIAPRAGTAWTLESPNLSSPTLFYYCPDCSRRAAIEQRAIEQSAIALTIIGEALRFSAPLGFLDEARVIRAIREAGEQAPQAAQAVADAITRGERPTVWSVVLRIKNSRREE